MYAHAYTLHDVLLLYNTTNLRILSSLGGDSEKRGFRICDYSKTNIKQHPDFGKKLNKTGNKRKFKKKIVPVIASCSENRSTLWNLWTLLLLNVYIWWTARPGNSDIWTSIFVLSGYLEWFRYVADGCHHHDADEKRPRRCKFQYSIDSTEPAKQVTKNHKIFFCFSMTCFTGSILKIGYWNFHRRRLFSSASWWWHPSTS